MPTRQGLLPLLLPLLLLLLPRLASGGARIYSIHPIGGPVRGDTSITVLGYSLENIECVFFSAWEEQRKVDERYRSQNAAEENPGELEEVRMREEGTFRRHQHPPLHHCF